MKNKSILYLALLCGLLPAALASCVKEAETSGAPGAQIVIGIENGEATRATPINESNKAAQLAGKLLGMRAVYYNGTENKNFFGTAPTASGMNAVTATVDNNSGNLSVSPSPTQMWPVYRSSSETMNFYAWYPYDSSNTSPAVGFSGTSMNSLYYDATAQQDLMIGRTTVNTSGATDPVRKWNESVPIHFNHALTQVSFTAKKAKSAMANPVIKSVTLENVALKGNVSTFPSTWPAKQVANDASIPAFTWAATETGNQVWSDATGVSVTSNTASVPLNTFLMIPMAFGGTSTSKIVVEVDGLGTFEKDLKDVVANHVWLSGRHYNYNMIISETGLALILSVEDWDDENPVYGDVLNRKLNVSATEAVLSYRNDYTYRIYFWSDQKSVTLETSAYRGESGQDDSKKFAYSDEYTISNFSYNSSTGAGQMDIKAKAAAYDKVARLVLNAGGLRKEIRVETNTIATFFAQSNIVMYIDAETNTKILTFAETTDDHKNRKTVKPKAGGSYTVAPIPANAQGLHFRWGSLVGVTGNGTNNTALINGTNNGVSGVAPSHVVFWPTEFSAPTSTWVWNNTATVDNNEVPFVTGSEVGVNPNVGPPGYDLDAFADFGDSGKGFKKDAGTGDICRYISDMGWVEGKWRMPTQAETYALAIDTYAAISDYNGVVLPKSNSWDTTYEEITGSGASDGTGNKYGYYPIGDVRIVGRGVTTASDLTNRGAATVVIPAAGYRDNASGILFYTGNVVNLWTTTPSYYNTTGAYAMYFRNANNCDYEGAMSGRTVGNAVRCIRAD